MISTVRYSSHIDIFSYSVANVMGLVIALGFKEGDFQFIKEVPDLFLK